MRLRLTTLAAALLAAFSLPAHAAAQTSAGPAQVIAGCTVKCGCYSDGCGCQSSGGNGSGCSASGDGCYVNACPSQMGPVEIAADGSLVALADDPSGRVAAAPRVQPPAAQWERVAPGHAVARDCRGVVVAEYYEPQAAEQIRAEARTLSL
jgi:hypothetical protein